MDIKQIRVGNLNGLLKCFDGSREDFAIKCGYSDVNYLNQLLTGKGSFGSRTAKKISLAFGKDGGWLDRSHENTEPAIARLDTAPLISNVQAGVWMEGIDEFEPNDAEDWIIKPKGGPNSYYLRVKGESMTAPSGDSFPEGMLILIDPDQQWSNGSYIIAKVSGYNGVTFKKLKYDEQDRPYLKALNPSNDWPNIYDEFRILGKMIFSIKFY